MPVQKRQKKQHIKPPFSYVAVDPAQDLPDPYAFLPKETAVDPNLDARHTVELLRPGSSRGDGTQSPKSPGTPRGGGGVSSELREYKALCELLLPGLRTQSHLAQLIQRCPWSVSVVLREHGVVIGGTTFRVIRSHSPPVLLLDVLLLAVDPRPGVCGHGWGTRLVNYMKAIALHLAGRTKSAALMLTQADAGGGVANQFWARQRLRATPQAAELLRALHMWDAANDLYAHSVPMACWLQPGTPAASCPAAASARAQESATVQYLLPFKSTRHTPSVRVKMRGALTLLPPIEAATASAPQLGLAAAQAGSAALATCSRCRKCGRGGHIIHCRACFGFFHAGCAALPRAAEARAAVRLFAAAAAALADLYPLLRDPQQGVRPDTVLCHACCALTASGGAEDGSGNVAVGRGKGASRLACDETVLALCEQGRAWWDMQKAEQAAREQQQAPARPGPPRLSR